MGLEKFRTNRRRTIDIWLLLAILALLTFGLIMVSSASVVVAWKDFGSSSYFFVKQAWAALVGVIALIILTIIDYRIWQRLAPWLGGLLAIFLILPHIPGFGITLQGAQRWIHIAGISIQPSEPVKILSILYLSAWFGNREQVMEDVKKTFFPFLIGLILIVLPILEQPDAGTALTLAIVLTLMFIVAGARPIHLCYLAAVGILGIFIILQSPYRAERLMTFLNPSQESLGAGYHINQALLAIGSGGWLGLGFGQSNQKYLFLPEVQTDSIFAVATEELGFLRMILVLGIYLVLIIRGYKIARLATDRFGQITAFGITSLIMVQAFVNISAMLGLIPLTGVTLPLISYGGSSLATTLAATGILLNISKHQNT